jgi:hypothetical protein
MRGSVIAVQSVYGTVIEIVKLKQFSLYAHFTMLGCCSLKFVEYSPVSLVSVLSSVTFVTLTI